MKSNSCSIRLSKEYILFSEKLQVNRIKVDVDDTILGHPKISELIVKYFKDNNDRYLELIKMEIEKNA